MNLSFLGISTEVAALFEALPSFEEDTQICFSLQTVKSVSIIGLGTVAGLALVKRAYTAATYDDVWQWAYQQESKPAGSPLQQPPAAFKGVLTTKQRVARYAAAAACFAAAGYEIYANGASLDFVTKLQS